MQLSCRVLVHVCKSLSSVPCTTRMQMEEEKTEQINKKVAVAVMVFSSQGDLKTC